MDKKVVAYYRTSSQTNVGSDKDSKKRQSQSVLNYTSSNGMRIIGEFYDKGVSGTLDVTTDQNLWRYLISVKPP